MKPHFYVYRCQVCGSRLKSRQPVAHGNRLCGICFIEKTKFQEPGEQPRLSSSPPGGAIVKPPFPG